MGTPWYYSAFANVYTRYLQLILDLERAVKFRNIQMKKGLKQPQGSILSYCTSFSNFDEDFMTLNYSLKQKKKRLIGLQSQSSSKYSQKDKRGTIEENTSSLMDESIGGFSDHQYIPVRSKREDAVQTKMMPAILKSPLIPSSQISQRQNQYMINHLASQQLVEESLDLQAKSPTSIASSLKENSFPDCVTFSYEVNDRRAIPTISPRNNLHQTNPIEQVTELSSELNGTLHATAQDLNTLTRYLSSSVNKTSDINRDQPQLTSSLQASKYLLNVMQRVKSVIRETQSTKRYEPDESYSWCRFERLKEEFKENMAINKAKSQERQQAQSQRRVVLGQDGRERVITPFQEQVMNFSHRIQRVINEERRQKKLLNRQRDDYAHEIELQEAKWKQERQLVEQQILEQQRFRDRIIQSQLQSHRASQLVSSNKKANSGSSQQRFAYHGTQFVVQNTLNLLNKQTVLASPNIKEYNNRYNSAYQGKENVKSTSSKRTNSCQRRKSKQKMQQIIIMQYPLTEKQLSLKMSLDSEKKNNISKRQENPYKDEPSKVQLKLRREAGTQMSKKKSIYIPQANFPDSQSYHNSSMQSILESLKEDRPLKSSEKSTTNCLR